MVNHRHARSQGSSRKTSPVETETRGVAESVEELVESYPASYVATCFGLGLGLGVVIGCLLAESHASSMRNVGSAERLGRNILDAVAGVLPESLASRIR